MNHIKNWFTICVLLTTFKVANAQTKIKLVRKTEYILSKYAYPKSEELPYRYLRRANNILIDPASYGDPHRPFVDGTVKVTSYKDITVNGTFIYCTVSTGLRYGLLASYPAVEAIKKIEFYDENGQMFFEDTYEYIPLYNAQLNKISNNSFSYTGKGVVYLSTDGLKTWNQINNIDKVNKLFSLSDDINISSAVILLVAYNPDLAGNPGVALWSNRPENYVLEFADGEVSSSNSQSEPNTSNTQSSATSNGTKLATAIAGLSAIAIVPIFFAVKKKHP